MCLPYCQFFQISIFLFLAFYHLISCLFNQCIKGLVNALVLICFRRCFIIKKIFLLCKTWRLLWRNLPLRNQIDFICNQHYFYGAFNKHFNFLNPFFCLFKAASICYVKNHNYSICDFVVRFCQWFIFLLSRSVPYLNFYSFISYSDFLWVKVNCNCCYQSFIEFVLYETNNQIGFSDSWFSANNNFYSHVVTDLCCSHLNYYLFIIIYEFNIVLINCIADL